MTAPRRAPLLLLLVLTCAVVPAVAAGRGRPGSGVLPVAGPAALTSKLAQELTATLVGKPVAGPDQVARRLGRDRDVMRSLLAAREALEQAERETLYMRREEAVRAAQRAIDSLDTVVGRLHAPALAARVQAALALALLLHPADEQGAVVAFRRAVAADPRYRPDPDRTPSRAQRLFELARREAVSPMPPTREELAILAELSGLDRLFWIGLGGGGKVELVAYDHLGRRMQLEERTGCPPGELSSTVAVWLGAHLPAVPPRSPAPAASRPTADHGRRAVATPWYRRWWVWAIAGVVVVGASVTVAVVATAPRETRYQFHVSY